MAELIVVSGPPGAGKSTVAALLADAYEPSAYVAGDAFFGFLRRGWVAPWLPEAEAQNDLVIATAAAAAGRLATAYTVVYDGVVGPWYLSRFLAEAGVRGLHYAVLLPPAAVCRQRVLTRVGHGFDDPAATARMHAQFAAGDLPERHLLRGTGTPDQVHDELRRRLDAGDLWVPA